MPASKLHKLSERESEVLRHAANGLVDKEIAVQMGVSVHTLRTYWVRIRGKLGVLIRTALAGVWLEGELREEGKKMWADRHLQDAWWEFDHETGMVTASDYYNSILGMEPGKAHRIEAYDGKFETVDRGRRKEIHKVAYEENRKWIILSNRAKLPEGRAYFYTASHLEYSGDKVVKSRGQVIIVLGEDLLNNAICGLWSHDPISDKFEADENCCRIFGLDPKTPQLKTAMADKVLDRDLKPFKDLFVSKTADVGFTIRDGDDKLVYVRATSTTRDHLIIGSMTSSF